MSDFVKIVIGVLAVVACVWAAFYFSPFQSCIREKLDSGAAVDRAQAAQLCTVP
jgi:hypothetical protein